MWSVAFEITEKFLKSYMGLMMKNTVAAAAVCIGYTKPPVVAKTQVEMKCPKCEVVNRWKHDSDNYGYNCDACWFMIVDGLELIPQFLFFTLTKTGRVLGGVESGMRGS